MTVLVDTNLLTRAAQPGHSMHLAAVGAVDILLLRGEMLVVAAQNLYGFWVVATRPPGENGLGLSVEQAQSELHRINTRYPGITVLDPREVFKEVAHNETQSDL